MLKTWTFSISQNFLRCLLLHLLRIVFAFFAFDHSPCARMNWILTTIPILFRRFQWQIDALLLEGKQRVSPFYRATHTSSSKMTFLVFSSARKSDRSFIGPYLPSLLKVRYHCPLYLLFFLWSEFVCMVFFRKFIPLFELLFCPSDCELWFTMNWISEESIVNMGKMFSLGVDFLTASVPRIPSYMVLFLFFGFAMSTWLRPFLIT